MVPTRDVAILLTALEIYPTRTHKLKTVMKVDNVIAYLKKKKGRENLDDYNHDAYTFSPCKKSYHGHQRECGSTQ